MNNDTGIYAITTPSGKQYIGSAVSFRQRWATHLYELRRGAHHSDALQRAYLKYGESALIFSKIALCPVTDLLVVEQRFIDKLKPEYNICSSAGSRLGSKATAQTRAKMSASRKGKINTAEHRRNISEAWKHVKKGRLSESHRAAIGAAHKGRIVSEQTRNRQSESIKRAIPRGADHRRARAVVCVETGERFPTLELSAVWLRGNGRPKANATWVGAVCLGQRKSAYGYHWRYAD